MNKSQSNGERKGGLLPGWLWPNSNILPQFYKQVWEAVRDDKSLSRNSLQRELLVDTNKIFPLLLTSQLPTDILGYIWSLANKKYAGQLTEQELYIVLALVALAQSSYPFDSLQVLHFIRVPPIPVLNVSLLNQVKLNSSSGYESQQAAQENIRKNPATKVSSEHVFHSESTDVKIINHLRRHRVPSSENKSHASSSSTDSGDEFSEFQSAPAPTPAPMPNITILESKHGSAIGSRLANHNLGSKKIQTQKKSNLVKNQYFNTQTQNFADSSNTRDSRNSERLSDLLFPKCSVKSQAKMTVILKDTVIRNNEACSKVVTSDSIKCDNESKDYDEFGSFVSAESSPNKDLMSLQPVEDKYSALRALVEEPSIPSSSQPESLLVNKPYINLDVDYKSPPADDFGDFVSAEQLDKQSPEPDPLNVDLLTDFDFNHYETGNKSDPSLMQEISEAFNALALETNTIQSCRLSDDKYEVFYETDKTTAKDTTKEDSVSINSIDIGNSIPENLPRSASVPSLDLKSFLVSSQEDDQPAENMHQMIYSEWKLYMENCVLLLQVAANIFMTINSENVLREVLASAQGYNFLCNLAEVAAVCRRVNFSHKEMDINIMGFDDLLMDIDKIWAVMEPFYADIPIVSELPVWPSQTDNITCALCLTVITSDGVAHNDNNYHLTCANLWLNCVNSNLPVLRYPSNH